MKNLKIEQFEEKDELNTNAFISSGIGSKVAMKQSIENDWISASESLLE